MLEMEDHEASRTGVIGVNVCWFKLVGRKSWITMIEEVVPNGFPPVTSNRYTEYAGESVRNLSTESCFS